MAIFKSKYDVIVVGTGVAGLNCVLNLPEDKSVLVISKRSPEKSDSYLAQGGICRLRGEDDYEQYFNDTMRAGHYENDPEAVECMIRSSQEIISDLEKIGVAFTKNVDGSFAYTREGGHTSARICYHEDCTGKEITSALERQAEKRKNVQIVPEITMLDIIEDGKRCYGVVVSDNADKKVYEIYSDYSVLACGGVGGAFGNTTNYSHLTGDAVAICMRHGVKVKHLDYIQIHPTTLYTKDGGRKFLISESVRGEGAHLLDKNMQRFTDELKPRDVVKDAVLKKMEEDKTDFVWLDMRPVGREQLEAHFPQIIKRCKEEGYDVFSECVPVVPAIHYFMGGIESDLNGRTSLNALYAVGETCCNGVHGKNRLASNSLLESLLFAKRAARDIVNGYGRADGEACKRAASKLDKSKYADADKLLEEYRLQFVEAVKKADGKE